MGGPHSTIQGYSDAGAIALALGGNGIICADGWGRCPCPAHQGTDSNLSIKAVGPGRLFVKCWSHDCPPTVVLRAIEQQLGTRFSCAATDFVDAEEGEPSGAETRLDDGEELTSSRAEDAAFDEMLRVEAAERLFLKARPIEHGDLVDRYFSDRRGIALKRFPAALRLHPGHYHRESQTTWPCLLAKVTVPFGYDRLVTVHRTFLEPDGAGKAPVDPVRKLYSSMRGGAVRLFDPGGDELLIGEGIETTISALVLSGWSMAGWAAISAPGIVRLHVPWRFRRVVIAADNDANGAGLRAARALAKRLRAEGHRVDVRMAPRVGTDWNDYLIAQTGGAA